jgi:hypothetical protein
MYKQGRIHVVVNALSILLDITEPTSVLDQTIDASLFYTKLESLNDVKEFLKACQIEGTLILQQKKRLVRRAKPFTLKNGELYRMGKDTKLRKCLTTPEA